MKTITTYISGPTYIGRDSSPTSNSYGEMPSVNYTTGIISHQVLQIKKIISTGFKSNKTNRFIAPKVQITSTVYQELNRFTDALEPFLCLEKGWDGEGSEGPSKASVEIALLTCFKLVQSGLQAPKPKIFSGGGLGCYWKAKQNYATIDFEEDGEHIWTVTDGKLFNTGTWKIGEIVPKAIDSSAEDFKS